MEYTLAGGGYGAGRPAYAETEYPTRTVSEAQYFADDGGATGGGTYVVQSGDTLSGIAAELGTTVEDLAAGNGIENPDLLYAGQTLYY